MHRTQPRCDHIRSSREGQSCFHHHLNDTGVPVGKLYQQLLQSWTREILDWSAGTPVLLGVPTYDDAGVGYHLPSVENLPNALLGIHTGLSSYRTLPDHYQGVAIYCEWETDEGPVSPQFNRKWKSASMRHPFEPGRKEAVCFRLISLASL